MLKNTEDPSEIKDKNRHRFAKSQNDTLPIPVPFRQIFTYPRSEHSWTGGFANWGTLHLFDMFLRRFPVRQGNII